MKELWRLIVIATTFILLMALMLMIGNFVIYAYWLPYIHLLAVLFLMFLYFSALYLSLYLIFFRKNNLWPVVGGLLFICIGLSLFKVTYWVIYVLYPDWGIILYEHHLSYNDEAFRSRMLRSFFSLLFVAAGILVYQLRYSVINELRGKLNDLKLQFSSAHLYPHFVESVTGTALGRSLLNASPGSRRSLEKLAGVMRYVLDARQETNNLVILEEEWRQVMGLTEVARWKYGKSKVKVKVAGRFPHTENTIPAGMLTLLENALKYTDLKNENHIALSMSVKEHGFLFTCINPVNTHLKHWSSEHGFGLRNLQMRIERSGLEISLVGKREGDSYTATWEQKFS